MFFWHLAHRLRPLVRPSGPMKHGILLHFPEVTSIMPLIKLVISSAIVGCPTSHQSATHLLHMQVNCLYVAVFASLPLFIHILLLSLLVSVSCHSLPYKFLILRTVDRPLLYTLRALLRDFLLSLITDDLTTYAKLGIEGTSTAP